MTDNSVITCDEIIEEKSKTVTTSFNEEKGSCKTKNFSISLAFLVITIALLIAVSIYCYMIKHKANRNTYYHFTSQITN